MEEKYRRVSCNLYDELESYATLKKQLLVNYFEKEMKIKEEELLIVNLETKDKSEYLVTEKGTRIRLDQIISITEL